MSVFDTGPLVALVDEDDDSHKRTLAWLESVRSAPAVIPAPVLGEAWYLIARTCGPEAEARFLQDLASGAYGEVVAPTAADLSRSAELVIQYQDFPLGGTDACVIAMAERLHADQVATLDRRHFTVVRPRQPFALPLT